MKELTRDKIYYDLTKAKLNPYRLDRKIKQTEEFCREIYLQNPQAKWLIQTENQALSYPLIKTFLKQQYKLKQRPAIIHFDAYADDKRSHYQEKITPVSWAHHTKKLLTSPQHFFCFGQKSITYKTVDTQLKKVLQHLKKQKINQLYICLDVHVFGADYVSACANPPQKNLAPDLCAYILSTLSAHVPIIAAEISELNPVIGIHRQINPEPANSILTVEMIKRFLLEQIKKTCP